MLTLSQAKKLEQQEIKECTEAFLSQGGKVTTLPSEQKEYSVAPAHKSESII